MINHYYVFQITGFDYPLFHSHVFLKRWQPSFYLILLVFMGSGAMLRTTKQSKGTIRQISYLIKMIKSVQGPRTLDIAT